MQWPERQMDDFALTKDFIEGDTLSLSYIMLKLILTHKKPVQLCFYFINLTSE